jgi:sortase A
MQGAWRSGLAVRMPRRRTPAILLIIGSVAVVTGAASIFVSLTPYFVNPSSAVVRPAPPSPDTDQSTVVQPTPDVALPPQPSPVAIASARVQTPVDGVWFEIRVPAVGYSAMVRQGVGLDILAGGPGHYPSTPWPGQAGNVGVAAHNTYWLSFSHLKPGDRVELQTHNHTYVYVITGSRVVSPTDRTALAPTRDARLTLTTCDPLWAGALATRRLVFSAREI